MADTIACACGHPTDGTPFEWAPGHLSTPLCICCMRRIWEATLANVTKALADYAVPETCRAEPIGGTP